MVLTEGLVRVEDLMSVPQAAAAKEVSRKTMDNWIESDKVDSILLDNGNTKIVLNNQKFKDAKPTPRGKGKRT